VHNGLIQKRDEVGTEYRDAKLDRRATDVLPLSKSLPGKVLASAAGVSPHAIRAI
jgi:hypothetical protein